MTKRIPQPRSELPPQIRVHEAQLLATMLRTSRLTWVFAEPGTDKSDLLKTGVLPLLQRRLADRQGAAPSDPSGAPRLPDRRRRASTSASPQRETALFFDSWQHTPLAELKQRIDAVVPDAAVSSTPSRLASALQDLRRSGIDLVLLLDRFEEVLALAPGEEEARCFVDELLEALASPDLPAHFLISMDESARPRLERFRARIPGFDHNVLRLSPIVAPSPPANNVKPVPAGATRRRIRPPPRSAVKVEDVYALIEATLARTAAEVPSDAGRTEDATATDRAPADGTCVNPSGSPGGTPDLPLRTTPARRFSDALRSLGRQRHK